MLIKNLNELQKAYLLHWVRSQDWGTKAYLVTAPNKSVQLCGLQSVYFQQGLWYKEEAVFDCTEKLKAWAGYGVNSSLGEGPVFTDRVAVA